jgi:hypothetical protein
MFFTIIQSKTSPARMLMVFAVRAHEEVKMQWSFSPESRKGRWRLRSDSGNMSSALHPISTYHNPISGRGKEG